MAAIQLDRVAQARLKLLDAGVTARNNNQGILEAADRIIPTED